MHSPAPDLSHAERRTSVLKRLGVTPGKLALIGALAFILMAVTAYQILSPSGSAPPDSNSQSADLLKETNDSISSETHLAQSTDLGKSPHRTPWPKLSLEEIASHNPFVLPQLRPAAAIAADNSQSPHDPQRLQALSELSATGVTIVMLEDGQPVARVGARTIRLGDEIAGYRVSKIDASGVWLVDVEESPEK